MARPVLQQEIRAALHSRLQELAEPGDSAIRETLLIRGGCYCGQRFTLGDYSAVWFFEEGEIKIYGPAGTLMEGYGAQQLVQRAAA